MNTNEERIVELEDEVHKLKAQLGQTLGSVETALWQALKNMPDGTVYHSVRDTKTGILKFDYVSGTWEQLSGVTIDDTIADLRNVFKHFIPEDLMQLMRTIEESLNPLSNFSFEGRYLHPLTGQIRWLQVSSYPRHEEEKICAYGFIFDVTARKEAEQKILIQNERLMALDKMPDGVLFRSVRNLQTGLVKFDFLSGSWERLTGVSNELTLTDMRNVFANIPPEDLQLLMQQLNASGGSMTKVDVEIRYLHPVMRKQLWFQVLSYPRSGGDKNIADGFIFDITVRKEAELESFAEKERLETLGNNLPDGVLYQFILDQQTGQIRLSFVSGKWESITGISPEIAKSNIDIFFAMIHPDDLPAVMQEIDNSAQTMDNFYAEFRITVQGSTRWVQMSSHPNRRDTLIIWDGIMLDTTERKEAGRELETEKIRLQALGNNLPGSTLYQFSRDSRTGQMRIVYVSGTWETVTGITPDDAMEDISKVFDLIDPDYLPVMIQSIADSARTMTDHEYETIFGGNRWIHVIARPRREDVFIVWDCIMTDITERKETERELDSERKRLQMLGDNLPNSSLYQFLRDSNTRQMRLSYVSGTWEAVTGIAADVALSDITKVFSMLSAEDFPVFLQSIEESARTLGIHKFESRFGDRWLSLIGRPRCEDNVIIWDGIITDITERKNTEAELAEYRENLELLVQERTNELNTANEELTATNEALYTINVEVNKTNEQLANEMEARLQIMKQLEENEAKLSEVLLEKQTAAIRLSLLQKSIDIALWDMEVVDPNDPIGGNKVFWWSPEFRKLLGFNDEQDFPNVLNSWSNRLHPEDKEKTLAAFSAHLTDQTGKAPYHVKYRLQRKTGEYGWYRADGETLRDENGKPLRVVGSIEEIEKNVTL